MGRVRERVDTIDHPPTFLLPHQGEEI